MADKPWQPPEDFPDLTIRDTEPAVPPMPRGIAAVPTPSGSQPQQGASGKRQWQVGDRVLAPWEPQFLYTGQIVELQGGEARIEFEDGDCGWVQLNQIRALRLLIGQKLLCRRKSGPGYFQAQIAELRGQEARVTFVEGGPDEWTGGAELRIPCEAIGQPARPALSDARMEFLDSIKPGQRVWAPWMQGAYFVGKVEQVKGEELLILFDDGDKGWVMKGLVAPFKLSIGMPVASRRRGDPNYYPGTITGFEGEYVTIAFDDGKKASVPTAFLAVPGDPSLPDARPVGSSASRLAAGGTGGGSWFGGYGWVIWGAIVVIGIIVRIFLRANR